MTRDGLSKQLSMLIFLHFLHSSSFYSSFCSLWIVGPVYKVKWSFIIYFNWLLPLRFLFPRWGKWWQVPQIPFFVCVTVLFSYQSIAGSYCSSCSERIDLCTQGSCVRVILTACRLYAENFYMLVQGKTCL